MARNIILIGSLKNNKNHYSILNELMAETVDALTEKFDQVFLLNVDLNVENAKIKHKTFDINQNSFKNFLSDHKINAIFTLTGGKSVQSFIYQFFTDHPVERKTVKFIGTNYRTIKILSNHAETERFLSLNRVKFPSVKLIEQTKEINLTDTPLTFPTRLRLISPKTHSLGLFYNYESLVQGIKDQQDEESVLQLEESALGDKEVEIVALRDKYQNTHILIRNEKIDPVGIHRDHSLVIYPTVTLLAREIDEIDRIVQRIMKELCTPIVQIRFAITTDHQYRVLSIHSDLTTSELIISKIRHLNLARIIVDLACGKTIIEISRNYDNLLVSDLDFFTIVAPYHEIDQSSVKSLTTASHKRANSLIISMESNLILGIRNTLIELGGEYLPDIEAYLTQLSDNHLVRQMMNIRIFRLFFILEAIKRDFLLEDIAEITKIDPGFLQVLKFVAQVYGAKKNLIENNWQKPNYQNSNTLFPVQAEAKEQLTFDHEQIVIRFDTKKVDHYSNVYRYYLREIIKLLEDRQQKIVMLNNSFDNFDYPKLTLIQLPMELLDFPADIDELVVNSANSYEFGVIRCGSKIVCSSLVHFNKNHQVQSLQKVSENLQKLSLKQKTIAATYSFELNENDEPKNLIITPTLSRSFYFSDPKLLKGALSLFVQAKLLT
ncbi:hypothetical protein [Xylocopilactobacillus apicola]|uniref:carbamoyl-phosphate synthase (ammonia) n=1 Tax=Xylocopilactobacillus apicola TaxID=2932184 RepID=A0AAU9DNE9_9LACO|nr:hypothetical protein [Xylocopilactobacillus apicola]BDR58602.1 hypothetical protein XA3_10430 [Xylocopilactobacillus apicola]